MKNEKQNFSQVIARFFRVYLPGERGFSESTIASYRDTFKQFLPFCQSVINKPPEKLLISDFSRDTVVAFLEKLDADGKSVSTRNQRLAALKCFFRYVQYVFPEYIDITGTIAGIRMKKQPEPTVNYMTVDGVSCVLRQPNTHTRSGYRDMLMLALMYDTAARVTEVTEIRIGDIRTSSPPTVVLHGKGSKDRIVPLSSKTADLVQSYLNQTNLAEPAFRDKYLFVNRSGEKLTRAGVAYVLKKYVDAARKETPSLIPDVFSPHCMRHSKAMHLLQAGVAIIYIRDFLGHTSIKTTEVYAKADGKSKRAALEAAYKDVLPSNSAPKGLWNDDDSLMEFLSGLCK